MRIFEVSSNPNSDKLSALAQFLLGRAEDTDAPKKISTKAFLNLARDMQINIGPDELFALSQQPPLNGILEPIDSDSGEVIFKGGEPSQPPEMSVDKARATVDKMAKRASKL